MCKRACLEIGKEDSRVSASVNFQSLRTKTTIGRILAGVAVMMSCGMGHTPASAQAITFYPPTYYPGTAGTIRVITAKLNADQYPDIALIGNFSHLVSVMINNGNGTFAPKVDYPVGVGVGPHGLCASDLDGDLDLDLLFSRDNGSGFGVIFNDGSGVFGSPVNYPSTAAGRGIAAADFDGDGDRDVVVGSWNGQLSIYTNSDGLGTFTGPVYSSGGFGVFVGDFDGDLDIDIASSNPAGGQFAVPTVFIHTNDGSGIFSGPVSYPTGGKESQAVFGADFDGDLDLDLVTTNGSNNTISVLVNDGTGAFPSKVDYPVGIVPRSVQAFDFDVDGDQDIVVANTDDRISVFRNTGGGAFVAEVDVPLVDEPISVAAADFDADLLGDLVVANWSSGNVAVLVNSICACDCHADPICDQVINNVQDVVATIGVAFRASPAIPDPNWRCPYESSDVNCDGVTSVIDVVKVINVAFRSATPATEFCDPCP